MFRNLVSVCRKSLVVGLHGSEALAAKRFSAAATPGDAPHGPAPTPPAASTERLQRLRQSSTTLRDFLLDTEPAVAAASAGIDAPSPSPANVEPDEEEFGLPVEAGAGSKSFFVETYGCQMNVSDSEIVMSVMQGAGYQVAPSAADADVVLLNTCAIRDKAEAKVWDRLHTLRPRMQPRRSRERIIGVLGCMAERLKERLLETKPGPHQRRLADLVVGPDAYRDLPRLVAGIAASPGATARNTQLSLEETYADIAPVRAGGNGVSAFVSIQRGCNNLCSYCIVPFTRGRERSRPVDSIVDEVRALSEQGYKEVTLLGQNVNSYNYFPQQQQQETSGDSLQQSAPAVWEYRARDGFRSIVKIPEGGVRFPQLLDAVARVDPEMRVRFTSPHPRDFGRDTIDVIKRHANICKALHVPAQSGSTTVLERMRRGYTREAYLELVNELRAELPGVALSSDFISGFCGETEAEHADTLSLLRLVGYDQAFMFAYSSREKTHATHKYQDDVEGPVKIRRLSEVIELFNATATERFQQHVGRVLLVLVEGPSRRSPGELCGRADGYQTVVFGPHALFDSAAATSPSSSADALRPGDYAAVLINHASSHSLRGTALQRTTLQEFARNSEAFQRMAPQLMATLNGSHRHPPSVNLGLAV